MKDPDVPSLIQGLREGGARREAAIARLTIAGRRAIARLVEAGHASRLLLSHDTATKNMWTRNGGNGLGYVPRLFLSRLERHGVPAAVTADLMTVNPRSLFEESSWH